MEECVVVVSVTSQLSGLLKLEKKLSNRIERLDCDLRLTKFVRR